MAHYRHLPVWKAAMDLAVHLEHAVRRFPRYHKYTQGSEQHQTGYFNTGFKHRTLTAAWRPPVSAPQKA